MKKCPPSPRPTNPQVQNANGEPGYQAAAIKIPITTVRFSSVRSRPETATSHGSIVPSCLHLLPYAFFLSALSSMDPNRFSYISSIDYIHVYEYVLWYLTLYYPASLFSFLLPPPPPPPLAEWIYNLNSVHFHTARFAFLLLYRMTPVFLFG